MLPTHSECTALGGDIPAVWGALMCSVAGMAGEIVTNPFDVVRTRLHLDAKRYQGPMDCLMKIAKNEGVPGLLKGCGAALGQEAVATTFGLGIVPPVLKFFTSKDKGHIPVYKRLLVGGLCGCISALFVNPFEVIKSRSQSDSAEGNKGVVQIARDILAGPGGFFALYEGAPVTMARASMNCALTTTAYSLFRNFAVNKGMFSEGPGLDTAAGFFCATVTCSILNPVDVVRARLYNQPRAADGSGALYKNPLEALLKVLEKDGPKGLYAGLLTSLIVTAPDRVVTFSVMEWMRRVVKAALVARRRLLAADLAFAAVDADGNGRIDLAELEAAFAAAFPPEHSGVAAAKYSAFVKEGAAKLMAEGDGDGDGSIDKKEFAKISTALVDLVKRRSQEEAFKEYDVDGDGRLTLDEVLTALRTVAPERQNRFLKQEQYEKVLEHDARKIFKKADADGNGYVSFEEFAKVIDDTLDLETGRALGAWLRTAGVSAVQP
eukprot:tig00020849_g14639.t1